MDSKEKLEQQSREMNQDDKTKKTSSPSKDTESNTAKKSTTGQENTETEANSSCLPKPVEEEQASVPEEVTATNLSPLTQSQSPSATTGSETVAANTAVAAIPDILSPPKSETQTDETNTATSSSPASDSQLSPVAPSTAAAVATTTITSSSSGSSVAPEATVAVVQQPINVVANGTIPKSSGKPLMAAMNKKLNAKPAAVASRAVRPRKSKALVAMYESEISDNKIGIKLCIKKADTTSGGGSGGTSAAAISAAALAVSALVGSAPASVTKSAANTSSSSSSKQQIRKRSRKSKARPRLLDSDDSEYETKRRKERTNASSNNNAGGGGVTREKKVSFSGVAAAGSDNATKEPVEQGDWGARLPEEILFQIFQMVVDKEGSLPTLFRLGRVCSLWRQTSMRPSLWKTMDLSTWIKEKYRTELKLKWFVDNRCSSCTELNVSNWKVSDINCFLAKLAQGAPNLTGITLAGWKNFNADHLAYLVDNMKKLERLDLSSINVEMTASKSAVGLQSLCSALQTVKERLTHLYLAHNRLAGIPQIVNILSTHCPNLVLLDLSNVTTQATSHGILHIEKLQAGCPKLRVLRVTNSHVTPSTATLQEAMDSAGFPDLEELSVAALTDESRVVGDEHLQRILKTSSKLKLLDVRGCTRLTHESLIRLPAWDIKHLFLSFCSVTRDVGSGLELIASKWAHSLIELDLAWANVQQPLDNALRALAEKGSESPLAHLNLCGSSVSDEAVKEILANCAHMSSINLSSCRGLPRGVKRLMQGPQELQELREVLKVQMKVKLPAQLKQEQEEKDQQRAAAAAAALAAAQAPPADSGGGGAADGGGGGGGGGGSQFN